MAVSKHELAAWAREFAEVVSRYSEGKGGENIFRDMAETGERQPNPELRHALTDVAMSGLQGKGFFAVMRSHPEVFDNWFISVFQYGMLYRELDKVLFRFADRPSEMTIDYFGPTAGRCDTKQQPGK